MTLPDPRYVTLLTQLLEAETAGDDAAAAALADLLQARYLELERGGTTPAGLPYPNPTDPVAEGASAIRALAEAIDPFADDTGWLTPPLVSGYVATAANETPQCRRRGGIVYWRGGIKPTSGNMPLNGTFNVINANGIPATCRPWAPISEHFGGAQLPASNGIIRVSGADGSMQFRTSATGAAYFLLSSTIYPAAVLG
jgi:hypothetical protein